MSCVSIAKWCRVVKAQSVGGCSRFTTWNAANTFNDAIIFLTRNWCSKEKKGLICAHEGLNHTCRIYAPKHFLPLINFPGKMEEKIGTITN